MKGMVIHHTLKCDVAGYLLGMLAILMDKTGPLEKEETLVSAVRNVCGNGGIPLRVERVVHGSRLRTIKEYIYTHFREGVTLADLENISGSDRFGIIRDFKETFRISPHAYQTILRINYSKKELRRGRQVLDVALDAGFYDQSHFIRVFKSYVGLTPSRYRIAAA